MGQDNKIIINKNGKKLVVTSGLHDPSERYASNEFSLLAGMDEKSSKLLFEGGNIFIDKKTNGEKFILIGLDTLEHASTALFLKDEHIDADSRMITMFTSKKKSAYWSKENTDKLAIRYREYRSEALQQIAELFDVKKYNIFIISQPNFHIDMAVRPLNYPYVLINNPEMAIENLKRMDAKFPNKGFECLIKETRMYYDELSVDGYSNCDILKDELIKQGFVPIEIGGIYGQDGEINFLNSIINKHQNGTLSYITNSAKSSRSEYDIELEKLFEQQLRKKVANSGSIYFIEGKNDYLNSGINSLRYYIRNCNGGIHCLCCEDPDFDRWA